MRACQTVPCQRRALQPEQRDLGLVEGPRARRRIAVSATTESLDLFKVRGVSAAGERIRRPAGELAAVAKDERCHRSPLRREGEWRAWGELVLARCPASRGGVDERRIVGVVGSANGNDGGGCGLTDADAVGLGGTVRDARQGGRRTAPSRGRSRLGRSRSPEGTTRSGGRSARRPLRRGRRWQRRADTEVPTGAAIAVGVRLIAPVDRVECVVHGDVGDGVHPRLVEGIVGR